MIGNPASRNYGATGGSLEGWFAQAQSLKPDPFAPRALAVRSQVLRCSSCGCAPASILGRLLRRGPDGRRSLRLPLGDGQQPTPASPARAALLALGLVLVWLATGPVLGALVRKVAGASRSSSNAGHLPERPGTTTRRARVPPMGDRPRSRPSTAAFPSRPRAASPTTTAGPSTRRWTTAFLFGVFRSPLSPPGGWVRRYGYDWPTSTDYYAPLADSFHARQARSRHRPLNSSSSRWYEYEAREGLTYPWDVSLLPGEYSSLFSRYRAAIIFHWSPPRRQAAPGRSDLVRPSSALSCSAWCF